MPTIADCLRKSKLPSGIKSYLRRQARDSDSAKAVQDYLDVVDGNITVLTTARDTIKTLARKEARDAKAKVKETSRPAPVQRKPTEPVPEVKAQERTALRPSEGKEVKDQESERLFSVKNEFTSRERELLDLETLDSPAKRTNLETLNEAKRLAKRGDAVDPITLAATIVAQPRELSAVESAGIALKMADLIIKHENLTKKVDNSTDLIQRENDAVLANRIQEEVDILTQATTLGGTVTARNLQARKLTINQDMSLVSVLARAKVKKGGKDLTDKEKAKLTEDVRKLEAKNEQLEKENERLKSEAAITVVKSNQTRVNRVNRITQKEDLNALYAKAGRLLRAGCHNN